MIVPMMRIRVMGVFVGQSFVAMEMTMLRSGRRWLVMSVLVMRIVDMYMFVLERLVCVRMAMSLGQVQPDTERHEAACG